MNYDALAGVYDEFTFNVEYEKRAEYFSEILAQNGITSGVLLDLACGTGTLSFSLEKSGFDVIGADISGEMLSVASAKKSELGSDVLFIQQDMRELELYSNVDACICALDSINHLESIEDVKNAFKSLSAFMEKGGVFIFDVNTKYKHTHILSDNCFVYENETSFLSWQNELNDDNSVEIYLDLFIEENGLYRRESEYFKEYIYSDNRLKNALGEADFEVLNIYDDLSFNEPTDTSQRKVFVCRKVK